MNTDTRQTATGNSHARTQGSSQVAHTDFPQVRAGDVGGTKGFLGPGALGYHEDTEAYLTSRHALDGKIAESEKSRAESGNAWKMLGYELDELYADIAVAKTGNYYK